RSSWKSSWIGPCSAASSPRSDPTSSTAVWTGSSPASRNGWRKPSRGESMINAGEISEIINRQLAGYDAEDDLQEVARVSECGDGIARVYGREKAMAGELLQFPHDVIGMVLNLEQDQIGAVLFGEDTAIKEGDVVKRTSRIAQVPVGEAVVGRVVN